MSTGKIEHISGSIVESFMQFVFIVCSVECYQNIWKLICRPLAFTSYKAFLKSRKRSGTSLRASVSAWFLKKKFSLVILYKLTKFNCLVAFALWDIGQYVYCNCLITRMWRHFEINFIFLIQPFSLHEQKIKTKI